MGRKLFLLLIISVAYVSAIPETVTKKCEESGFCSRCRRPQENRYEALLNTIRTNLNGFEINVKNDDNPSILNLKLTCHDRNTFHFEMDEVNPLKPRYRVDYVIEPRLAQGVINGTVTNNQTLVTAWCGDNRATVENYPLRIKFYRGDDHVITVNDKDLLRYEYLRSKPQFPQDEVPGEWAEEWGGAVDSKPNGPEAVAVDFHFEESEVLYGIPEHHDSLILKSTLYGEPYRLFTVDMTFFELESRRPNYGVVPVLYGHSTKTGNSVGIYWQNTADTYVDIYDGKDSHFISEGGIIDVFVFLGPSPSEVYQQYTMLTGIPMLPPLYTLAYHQCRWSYYTEQEVLDVVAGYDEHEIPLDTMWLDIDYTDGKRYFTWNLTAFPDPLDLISTLNDTGRHLIHIIDPHIKKDDDYFYYRENRERGYFVKTANGSDFEGICWPGDSSYVDFWNPQAIEHYSNQYLLENFPQSVVESGIWNDMNEPAVFEAPEKTFPRDAVHFGGIEHRLVHNAYGYMHTKGTYLGLLKRTQDKLRPFILTRSFFAGSQKYTAVWTGDNSAEWGHLQASVHVCLVISVSGFSFCGADVGGFWGNPEEELFIRWNQAGAFQPFFRNHASEGTLKREPWEFENRTTEIVRDAIIKRYTFLPLWYTMFFEHTVYGLPIMRPMFTNYPRDLNVLRLEHQYMLWDKLLVAPVLERGATYVIVRFPSIDGDQQGELWYDIDSYHKYDAVGTVAIHAPIDKTPVFQRGGTIIPRKLEVGRSSIEMRDKPFSLYVAVDAADYAVGTLYYDDETTFEYHSNETFDYLEFTFQNESLTVNVHNEAYNGIKFGRIYFAGTRFPSGVEATCLSSEQSAILDIQSEDESDGHHFDAFYVDVSEIECDYNWSLTFVPLPSETTPSGSSKNILGGILIFLATLLHAFKMF